MGLWNSLPGVEPVKGFKSAKVAANRIWDRIQRLGEAAPLPARRVPVAPGRPGATGTTGRYPPRLARRDRRHVALHPQQRNHRGFPQQDGVDYPPSLRLPQLRKLQTPAEGLMWLTVMGLRSRHRCWRRAHPNSDSRWTPQVGSDQTVRRNCLRALVDLVRFELTTSSMPFKKYQSLTDVLTRNKRLSTRRRGLRWTPRGEFLGVWTPSGLQNSTLGMAPWRALMRARLPAGLIVVCRRRQQSVSIYGGCPS